MAQWRVGLLQDADSKTENKDGNPSVLLNQICENRSIRLLLKMHTASKAGFPECSRCAQLCGT